MKLFSSSRQPSVRTGRHGVGLRVGLVAALLAGAGLPAITLAAPEAMPQNLLTATQQPFSSCSADSPQGVKPTFLNAAAKLDGRPGPGSFTMMFSAINADPFEAPDCLEWNMLGEVNLVTGSYAPIAVDIAVPWAGPTWYVARSYNSQQGYFKLDNDTGKFNIVSPGKSWVGCDSTGLQGNNWFQNSLPGLSFTAPTVSTALVASTAPPASFKLIAAADQFLNFEFATTVTSDGSHHLYRGVNGTSGWAEYSVATSGPDTVVVVDRKGMTSTFLGQNTAADYGKGRLWKQRDAAGRETSLAKIDGGTGLASKVADATEAKNSLAPDGNVKAWVQVENDGSTIRRNARYTYDSGTSKLIGVALYEGAGTSSLIQSVAYEYYTGSNSLGVAGDLKSATVTIPLSETSQNITRTTYYRYQSTFEFGGVTYSSGSRVRLVLGPEGYRQAVAAIGAANIDGKSDDDLGKFADSRFIYSGDPLGRVTSVTFSGMCGCTGGGALGYHDLSYGKVVENDVVQDLLFPAPTATSTYSNSSVWYTEISQPDGMKVRQYFDIVGQTLSTVRIEPTNEKYWATIRQRDKDGRLTAIGTPAATSFSSSNLTNPDAAPASTAGGMVTFITRSTTPGTIGLPLSTKIGSTWTVGSATTIRSMTYSTGYAKGSIGTDDPQLLNPLIASSSVYPDGTTAQTTDYTYNPSTGFPFPADIEVKAPGVDDSTHNGPGTAVRATSKQFLRADGSVKLSKDPADVYSYSGRNWMGLPVISIRDANPSSLPSSSSGYNDDNDSSTISVSGASPLVGSTSTYDAQGRLSTSTRSVLNNNSRGTVTTTVTYGKMADGRAVTLSTTAGGSTLGPGSVTIANLAGKTEFSATVAATTAVISNGQTSPLSVVSSSSSGGSPVSLVNVTSTLYDPTGTRATSIRRCFALGMTAWPGSSGTNYDETSYSYDNMGRVVLVTDPTGTQIRTTFDKPGRVSYIERGDGTTFVTVEKRYYDGASSSTPLKVGNGYLTSVIRSIDLALPSGSSSNDRTTTIFYDFRGRVVGTGNPVPPHSSTSYDNLDRPFASAEFASFSTSTGVAVPTTETDRLSYNQTAYDERGQVYQSIRHNIKQPGVIGAGKSAESITTNNWFDIVGRPIMSIGSSLSKTQYDRLGRPVVQATLASVAEASYSSATGGVASGDVVLEQTLTLYDTSSTFSTSSPGAASSSGQVLLQVQLSRHHDNTIRGSLGSFSSTPIVASGVRPQFMTIWTDALGRRIANGNYGTSNPGITLSALPTLPTSSTPGTGSILGVLLSSSVYDSFGRVEQSIDTGGKITKTLFDDASRKIAEIRNYTAGGGGSLSSATRDNDLYTRYDYSNGLMTRIWVDINGNGTVDSADDQVTTYDYTQPTSSAPSGPPYNNLLRKVTYPAGSAGTNVVQFGYNNLGEQSAIWDQNGTQKSIAYDNGGRKLSENADTLGSLASGIAVDGTVRQVALTYTARGQVASVSQYASTGTPTSGSELDQVIYTYDGWGNVLRFGQDHNGKVNEDSSNDSVALDNIYSVNASSTSRTSPRLDYITLGQIKSGGAVARQWLLDYSSGTIVDSSANRVTELLVTDAAATTRLPLASYRFLGVGTLVGTTLEEPASGVSSNLYLTSGSYDGLDNWNRTVKSRWMKGSTALFNQTIAYDTSSAITSVADLAYRAGSGHATTYTHDGLHRLIKVEEGDSSAAASFGTEDWSASGPGKLSQTGNWNGVSRSSPAWGAVARSITGTFNKVNELLSFVDTQSGTAVTTTQAYSPNGELIDDGARYLYRYDAWGRMVEVKSRDGKSVSRYRYNGLGYRIGWQYHHPDTSGGLGDGIVDADPWYWLVYNDRWQQIAAYRVPGGSSSSWSGSAEARPKEIITHHMAGMDGRGGSSYIDSVVCRERDNAGWGDAALSGSGASAWAIASRVYLLQNWRADVVMSLSSDTSKAVVIDRVRYTAYGQPIRWSAYDLAGGPGTATPDASLDGSDNVAFINAFALPSTIADVNFDGIVDGTDYLLFTDAYAAGDEGPLGPGFVSRDLDAGFRRGYAGYEFDPVLSAAGGGIYHVRNRVYDSETGRWDRRDPLGYVDGMGLYTYVANFAIDFLDPLGLCIGCDEAMSTGTPGTAPSSNPDKSKTPATSTPTSPPPKPTPPKKKGKSARLCSCVISGLPAFFDGAHSWVEFDWEDDALVPAKTLPGTHVPARKSPGDGAPPGEKFRFRWDGWPENQNPLDWGDLIPKYNFPILCAGTRVCVDLKKFGDGDDTLFLKDLECVQKFIDEYNKNRLRYELTPDSNPGNLFCKKEAANSNSLAHSIALHCFNYHLTPYSLQPGGKAPWLPGFYKDVLPKFRR